MRNNYEKNVPYIVYLKDNSKFYCLFESKFCGYLVNNSKENFYFEINGSRMLVIVPHNEIEYMFPSRKHFDMYKFDMYKKELKRND